MAACELKRNAATRYCVFYIDNSNDIPSLPTSKKPGKGELSLSETCSIGSVARDMLGKKYTLNGHDEWVVFNTNEQDENNDIDIATDDEVSSMLDDVLE